MNLFSKHTTFAATLGLVALFSASCASDRGQAQVRENATKIVEQGWKEARAKDYSKAIATFQQARVYAPKLASPYFGIGSALTQQKKWAEAIPFYQKFIALDPHPYSAAYSDLGLALLNTGQLDEAKDALEKSIRVGPNNAQAYFGLAQYYASDDGDWNKANYYATQAAARQIDIPTDLRNRINAGLAASR